MSDMIYAGGAVKTIGSGEIGGWLVYFSGPSEPDAIGDYFDSETDFGLLGDGDKRYGYLEHGLGSLDNVKIGTGELTIEPRGVWLKAKLNLKDGRIARVFDDIRAGGMWFSSGSAGHLVRRQQMGNARKVLSWPIVEWSVTSKPAERRAAILSVKSVADREALRLQAEVELLRFQFLRLRMGQTEHGLLRRAR